MILDLFIGTRRTPVSLHPDPDWPGQWRIHRGDQVSDMVNLTRAKDAAIAWARPRGLGSGEVAHWRTRQTRQDRPPVNYSANGVPDIRGEPK